MSVEEQGVCNKCGQLQRDRIVWFTDGRRAPLWLSVSLVSLLFQSVVRVREERNCVWRCVGCGALRCEKHLGVCDAWLWFVFLKKQNGTFISLVNKWRVKVGISVVPLYELTPTHQAARDIRELVSHKSSLSLFPFPLYCTIYSSELSGLYISSNKGLLRGKKSLFGCCHGC